MKLNDFDYELPPELIAQEPAEPRDAARLCVHGIAPGETHHAHFSDLPGWLREGDLVVVNQTRVRQARLVGRRPSGGVVELLLLESVGSGEWRALVHPARRLKADEELELEGGALRARMLERPRGGDGRVLAEWRVALEAAEGSVEAALEHHGRAPLPPYIRRPRGADDRVDRDRKDYQTMFARETGAIAAPTAGLHFTPRVLRALEERGVQLARITLHVGEGTFRTVESEEIDRHEMHAETFRLETDAATAVEECRARGGRVVAVGTTTTRVLETCATDAGGVRPGEGSTDLFIRPGFSFRVVDLLVTNFHLPRSTLLMLVSAFAGREEILELYREAVERRYRFYSFGDAMLLARSAP